jgi:hypothetical protein
MTERKPAGMRFESWVERQIREAQERGEFDNLAGAGKPLPGLTGQYDDMWWVKQVVQRERLSLLPSMLALRKEAEELLAGLADVPSELAVRDQVEDYNARVVAAIRQPRDGPMKSSPNGCGYEAHVRCGRSSSMGRRWPRSRCRSRGRAGGDGCGVGRCSDTAEA